MTVSSKELHRVVVTAIVYKPDYTYLITKHSTKKISHPDRWLIPGGGLTTDDYLTKPSQAKNDTAWLEPLETALRREIKEETGLKMGTPELLTNIAYVRPDGIPVLVLSYFAPYVSGGVVLEEGEATEYAWVTAKEAEKYNLVGNSLDEIKSVDTILKSR